MTTPQPKIADEMVEAVIKALHNADCDNGDGCLVAGGSVRERYERFARAAVEAVAPLIAAQVLRQRAEEITAFADRRRESAYRYAPELDICARRSNDCVVNAYYTAAALVRDGKRRNTYCANCGDTRGGPFGHETSECTWKPCNSAEDGRERSPATDDLGVSGGTQK